MTQEPDFKGYIHDVGGPTANFRQPACEKQLRHGRLPEPAVPVSRSPARTSSADHKDYLELLRKLRKLPKREKGLHPFRHPF